MKKIYLLLMAAAAIVACNKQPVADEPAANHGSYVFSINASLSGETRTDYDADGKFSWTKGDQISVLFNNGTTDKFFALTAQSDGATSKFVGTIDEGYTIGASDGTAEDLKIWALYPASENHAYEPGSNPTFYVQPAVDFTEVPFSANLPMYDLVAEEGDLAFKNLTCAYKFTVKDLDPTVKKVRFVIYNQTTYALSGSWPIHNDKYLKYDYASPGSDNSTLTFTNNVVDNQAVFFVPCRYWGKFQPIISIYDAETDYLLKQFTAGAEKQPTDMTTVPRITLSVPDKPFVPAIKIDGDLSDWEQDGVQTFAGINERIVEWKAMSDAESIYFQYKITKSKIKTNGSSTIYIGFNTDNDATTGSQSEHGAAGNNGGLEALAFLNPWAIDGEVVSINSGVNAESYVQQPVNTTIAGAKITVDGIMEDTYVYLEISVPRSALGELGSTMTVKHAMQYYPTNAEVVNLL